jgi:hypothetical protein
MIEKLVTMNPVSGMGGIDTWMYFLTVPFFPFIVRGVRFLTKKHY